MKISKDLIEDIAEKSEVNSFMEHSGILGMKWGIRRYQNPDGSLTSAGKARYNVRSDGKLVKKSREQRKAYQKKVESIKKANEKKKKIDEIKKRVLEKNDLASAVKNQQYFTNRELQDINTRAALINQINNNRVQNYSKVNNFIKATLGYADSMKKIYDLASSDAGYYATDFINKQLGTHISKLPRYSQNNGNDKKKDKQN